jgi:hypothetical protein
VSDGDSTVPNAKGRKPCDREGWPGHWVVHFSSGFAPRIVRQRDGSNPPQFDAFNEPDALKLGFFVQVNGNVDFNGSQQQPGVFLNHSLVCFSAFGPEIFVGPDPTQAGFGGAPLPPGASMTPPANFTPPAVPGGVAPPPLVPGVPGAGAPMPPVPGAPVAPPAAPARVMTAAANGATYEAMLAAGWTDATLIQHGMMQAAPVAPQPPGGGVGGPPGMAPQPPAAPVAPLVPVAPNAQFVQVPGVPGAPGTPPVPGAPAAPPARQLTVKANGATYEQLIAAGWSDATLVQHGMMTA